MTQPNFKIKRGDQVVVTTGSHKGKTGTVSKVFLKEAKVIVDGVNVVTRHQRPSAANPEGKVEKTRPLHISNVALVDPSDDKAAKVGYRFVDGKKERFFKKSGNTVEVSS